MTGRAASGGSLSVSLYNIKAALDIRPTCYGLRVSSFSTSELNIQLRIPPEELSPVLLDLPPPEV